MKMPTPPPAETPHVLFNRERNKADAQRAATIRRIDEDEQEFNALLTEFSTHPVVILEEGLISRLRRTYSLDALQILQSEAKATDRLFIELWHHFNGTYDMTVKNAGRSGQLVANLLLIAKPVGKTDHPLEVTIKPKSWRFQFHRPEGTKLLHGWLDYCRTNTRAQFALNFGPALHAPVEFDDEGNFK